MHVDSCCVACRKDARAAPFSPHFRLSIFSQKTRSKTTRTHFSPYFTVSCACTHPSHAFRQKILHARFKPCACKAAPTHRPEPTDYQKNRALVLFEPRCVGGDFVPALDPRTRRAAKPQPVLDYEKGGSGSLGFARCLAVRQGEYKLARGRLYKFRDGSHVKASCNEVSDPSRGRGREGAARRPVTGAYVSPREPSLSLPSHVQSRAEPTLRN